MISLKWLSQASPAQWGWMLQGFLNRMTYKYFSSVINEFHFTGLLNLHMSLLESKAQNWTFCSQMPRFLFHILPLKYNHLWKQNLWGRKAVSHFANQAEAWACVRVSSSSAPAFLILLIMWPSNDRTGSRMTHFDGTWKSNGAAVKNTQDDNETWLHSRCCGDKSRS